MRELAIRARRSRTPARPQRSAVITSAARAGPRSAGKWVGQPTPFFTTSPAATNGNAHAHESAYAKTTNEASGERLTPLAIGSSLLVTLRACERFCDSVACGCGSARRSLSLGELAVVEGVVQPVAVEQ